MQDLSQAVVELSCFLSDLYMSPIFTLNDLMWKVVADCERDPFAV